MNMPSNTKIVAAILASIVGFIVVRCIMLQVAKIEPSFKTIFFFGKGVGSECTDDEPCGSDKLECSADTGKCIAKE